jgi:hypothetical protein
MSTAENASADSANDTRTPLARNAEINCKIRDSIIYLTATETFDISERRDITFGLGTLFDLLSPTRDVFPLPNNVPEVALRLDVHFQLLHFQDDDAAMGGWNKAKRIAETMSIEIKMRFWEVEYWSNSLFSCPLKPASCAVSTSCPHWRKVFVVIAYTHSSAKIFMPPMVSLQSEFPRRQSPLGHTPNRL